MSEPSLGLEKLELWRVSVDFAVKVCKAILPVLPAEERYALAQQIRRSVQSIPANIAEGYGRFYYLDTIRFCYIARGSLEEVYTQLVLAQRLGYGVDLNYHEFFNQIQTIRKLINGYIAFLKKNKIGEKEPGTQHIIHESIADYELDESDQLPEQPFYQSTDSPINPSPDQPFDESTNQPFN